MVFLIFIVIFIFEKFINFFILILEIALIHGPPGTGKTTTVVCSIQNRADYIIIILLIILKYR